MPGPLCIEIPDAALDRLRALADRERRTPEMQALWLIEGALDRHDRAQQMMRPAVRRPGDLAVQNLTAALREAHVRAGQPSTRRIAADIGDVSHTTIADTLKGKRCPSWNVTRRLAEYLGGDAARFRELWTATRP